MMSTQSPIRSAVLVASGDLREAANRMGWPAQDALETNLRQAFARHGVSLTRGHPYEQARGHGFISTQRQGMDVFEHIDPASPIVVAEAVWQYTHHVLAGLRDHRGPILTAANWSGEWPGLVGMLNLNASLAKAQIPYSSLWSETFQDAFADGHLATWIQNGSIVHDTSHVRTLHAADLSAEARATGAAVAEGMRRHKAILGVFDEGCMGMYNAILDDEHLNPVGIYKERLSQSALVAEMRLVEAGEVAATLAWLRKQGMSFELGKDPETELTLAQVQDQIRMYIAAARLADRFGCDAIGIQYQQGLAEMVPASDLAEGLLNDRVRPPVTRRGSDAVIRPGQPITHFNEVDEGAGVDALVTTLVWNELGLDPSTTLHDVRWGAQYRDDQLDDFVWVFEISGAVPPSHLDGGYRGATSRRQPPMYFPLGGGTISGTSRPGEVVWSRVFLADGRLQVDLGRATAVRLPEAETRRRLEATTPQWPIMHAVLHGVTRDQMMARHHANHVNVVYAPDAATADLALQAKAAAFLELGVPVHGCGATGVPG
jgi:hypothetical protein